MCSINVPLVSGQGELTTTDQITTTVSPVVPLGKTSDVSTTQEMCEEDGEKQEDLRVRTVGRPNGLVGAQGSVPGRKLLPTT